MKLLVWYTYTMYIYGWPVRKAMCNGGSGLMGEL